MIGHHAIIPAVSLAVACLLSPPVSAQEIPAQTVVIVRTIDAIDSRNADLSREYNAGLDEPLVVNGATLAPRGAPVFLRVVEAQQAGVVRGRASLTLKLVGLVVDGRRVAVETSDVKSESGSQGAKATRSGVIGGVVGGAIGGLLGGASGAAKGAAAGAATGVGVAAISGQRVQVPTESRLLFTLATAASIQP